MGRPKKQHRIHPVCVQVNKAIKKRKISKTEFACELIKYLPFERACNRSWHVNVFRYLNDNPTGRVVDPGPHVMTGMLLWLKEETK